MSEKTWPNWNISPYCTRYLNPWLSMSEKTWPNWNACLYEQIKLLSVPYPCLKRRGPIETLSNIDSCAHSRAIHVWKDVAQLKPCSALGTHTICILSMSEKTWPNWNQDGILRFCLYNQSIHVWKDVAQLKLIAARFTVQKKNALSMSEKTWPNWNLFWGGLHPLYLILYYPCLKRRGPIETRNSLYPQRFHLPYPCLKRRGPIETSVAVDGLTRREEDYPCLKRRGPIETLLFLL